MLSDEVFPIFLFTGNDEMAFCIGVLQSLGVKSCYSVILCLEILLTLVFRNIRQIAFLFPYHGYLTVFCSSVGLTGREMAHSAQGPVCHPAIRMLLTSHLYGDLNTDSPLFGTDLFC